MCDPDSDLLDSRTDGWCWIIYEQPKNRRVFGCIFRECFQLWSASKSIPLGACVDVARSYIVLALGLLLLNCFRSGIGGGIVP